MGYILFGIFAALMGAGAVSVVFRWGESEGVCQYDYIEEEEEK